MSSYGSKEYHAKSEQGILSFVRKRKIANIHVLAISETFQGGLEKGRVQGEGILKPFNEMGRCLLGIPQWGPRQSYSSSWGLGIGMLQTIFKLSPGNKGFGIIENAQQNYARIKHTEKSKVRFDI